MKIGFMVAVAEEGWMKAAMDKMHKIDSFVHETPRLGGLSIGFI
jgi:hypothetical protein